MGKAIRATVLALFLLFGVTAQAHLVCYSILGEPRPWWLIVAGPLLLGLAAGIIAGWRDREEEIRTWKQ